MKAATLPDRGIIKLGGKDARKLLNGLVTTDISQVSEQRARFAALLTPQGKIIADFIVVGTPHDTETLFLDCPRALVDTLTERLGFYKLRAKVSIENLSDALAIMAFWDGAAPLLEAPCYRDPRLGDLGLRAMIAPGGAQAVGSAELVDAAAYEAHRIALGVPAGGLDFAYADAFPHEADMDQLGGVDFDKGCFIGQEVVSRMEHRGTARTRVVPVMLAGAPPPPGTAVTADERPVGVLGSAAGERALAALRLDRVEEALASGLKLRAHDTELTLRKPSWARFAFPGERPAPDSKANP